MFAFIGLGPVEIVVLNLLPLPRACYLADRCVRLHPACFAAIEIVRPGERDCAAACRS